MMSDSDLTGVGRDALLLAIRLLSDTLAQAYDNLAATQKRCNELLEEVRALKGTSP